MEIRKYFELDDDKNMKYKNLCGIVKAILKGKCTTLGSFLAVQWLGLSAFIAVVPGSIPSLGTKIPQAAAKKKQKRKRKCITFNCIY